MKKSGILAKIISAVLAASVIFCFSSCSDTTWVYSSGEDTVSAGVYLGYLVDAYYSAQSSVTDTETELFKQKIDDMNAADYIKKVAKDSVATHIAVSRLFDEYGLEFTEKELNELESNIESIWANAGSVYEENGCGKDSFAEIIKIEEMKQKVFEFYYGEDGKEPLSEKDRKDYFSKNYAKIKYVAVTYSNHFKGVSTASEATDAQKTELKKIAEDYVARINKGEKIDKISGEEQLAAHKVEAGSDHADHDHSNYDKTELEDTFITKDTSEKPSDFNKAVFDAKYDVATMTEYSTYGYYVFVRYETKADSKDYTDRAVSVLTEMKGEDFDKFIDKSAAQIKLTANNAAVKRYKPQNVVFEY